MASLVMPTGQLISWGSYSFTANRTRPLDGAELAIPANHRVQPAGLATVDGYAGGVAPLDYVLPYEYILACRHGALSPGQDVQAQQDPLTALLALGLPQTLLVYRWGTTDVVSGKARIDRITWTSNAPTRKVLNIYFFVEGGLYF